MFWHRSLPTIWRQWIIRAGVPNPRRGAGRVLRGTARHALRARGANGPEPNGAQAERSAAAARAAEGSPDAGAGQKAAAAAVQAPGAVPAPSARPSSDGRPIGPAPLDEPLAIAICNGCFRIRRNALEMAAAASQSGDNDGKKVRSIARALDKMDDFLKESGIEYRDPTGQVYDPGRQDFRSIGEPEAVAGLTVPTIIRLERPVVLLRGKLVQQARGVVGKPAS